MNNIPMINPDVITVVSLFLLFVFSGMPQGYLTVILAHISFCTPYVVLNVMPKSSPAESQYIRGGPRPGSHAGTVAGQSAGSRSS